MRELFSLDSPMGRARHTQTERVLLRCLVVLVVLVLVVHSVALAMDLVHRAWPKHELTVEEAFQVGQFVVLVLGLASVVLLWSQGRSTARWNKLICYHEYFDDRPSPARRAAMFASLSAAGGRDCLEGRGKPISPETVKFITLDPDHHQAVTVYLDEFEQLCGAIRCGVINEPYARELERTRVVRIYTVFKPLIEYQQKTNPNAYLEFSIVAERWAEIRAAEEAADKAQEQAMKKERRRKSGVKPAAP